MLILNYTKKYHKEIIWACVRALRQGKVVAYPTDTSYGLAVDAMNLKAVKRLYKIKERGFNKPVHVVVPSLTCAKKIVKWSKTAEKLAEKFWPGPLTLVLGLRGQGTGYRILSAKTGTMGVRMPRNQIALDLSRALKKPITATSANPPNHLGGDDSYSAEEIVKQFQNKKHKPDIIINAGKLPRRKPSTMVRVLDGEVKILRSGPISKNKIANALSTKH